MAGAFDLKNLAGDVNQFDTCGRQREAVVVAARVNMNPARKPRRRRNWDGHRVLRCAFQGVPLERQISRVVNTCIPGAISVSITACADIWASDMCRSSYFLVSTRWATGRYLSSRANSMRTGSASTAPDSTLGSLRASSRFAKG